jgi:hypothetical protein
MATSRRRLAWGVWATSVVALVGALTPVVWHGGALW